MYPLFKLTLLLIVCEGTHTMSDCKQPMMYHYIPLFRPFMSPVHSSAQLWAPIMRYKVFKWIANKCSHQDSPSSAEAGVSKRGVRCIKRTQLAQLLRFGAWYCAMPGSQPKNALRTVYLMTINFRIWEERWVRLPFPTLSRDYVIYSWWFCLFMVRSVNRPYYCWVSVYVSAIYYSSSSSQLTKLPHQAFTGPLPEKSAGYIAPSQIVRLHSRAFCCLHRACNYLPTKTNS